MSKPATASSMLLHSRMIYGSIKSFALIPITNDCPYTEAIYDSRSGILAIILNKKKQGYDTMPKLDEFGRPQMKAGKGQLMERKVVDEFIEIHMIDKTEIQNFIELFAYNVADFDFLSIINPPTEATAKAA